MDVTEFIGVIGSGSCPEAIYRVARELGFEIGKRGWTLICGGLGGVMEGAARGCMEAGGMTVGLLPGLERASANPYIKIPIPTGLDEGRNLLVVRASQVVVAVSGGYGTLSEIALALKMGKRVLGIDTWKGIQGVDYVSDHHEAIRKIHALNLLSSD